MERQWRSNDTVDLHGLHSNLQQLIILHNLCTISKVISLADRASGHSEVCLAMADSAKVVSESLQEVESPPGSADKWKHSGQRGAAGQADLSEPFQKMKLVSKQWTLWNHIFGEYQWDYLSKNKVSSLI